LAIYAAAVVAVYACAWMFSRATERKTPAIRRAWKRRIDRRVEAQTNA
jgi:hypothetical protein